MRRQLALVAAATTSLVVLALLIPLARAVSTIPRDRAISTAQLTSQSLAQTISAVRDPARLRRLVEQTSELRDRSISVQLPSGEVLGASVPPSAAVVKARGGEAVAAYLPGGDLEVLTPTVMDGGTAVVRVVVPQSALRRGVLSAWAVLAVLGLLLVLLAVAVSDRLARSMLRPIDALAITTRALEQGDLDARVVPAGPAEVREVGVTLNLLAARINELRVTEREAVADLSHRLRTPITALRLDVEGLHDEHERRRLAADVDEVARSVDELIRTAREPMHATAVSADAALVARERAAFWAALAEEQGRPFEQRIPDQVLRVGTSDDALAAAIDVLIENVFSHTEEGTAFAVEVESARTTVVVRVRDAGPGFDRRSLGRGTSGTGSTGLGLDIATTTARRAGGRLIVESAGAGGCVALELPLLAPS